VELRDGIRRGIGVITRVPGMNSPLARQVKTLRLGCAHHLDPIYRTALVRDPYAGWCGRRGVVRPLPIPIGHKE